MDIDSESNLGESSQSSTFVHIHDNLAAGCCVLCHRTFSSDNDTGDFEAISVCGDCKFLLMEDLEPTSPDVYPRRMHVSRRRYDSSESIESMFSQQLSEMIDLARQNHSSITERDVISVDGDSISRLDRHISRTTPSGSRGWRRGFSDTESDALDSLYGESESNASFRRYRAVHGGEADTISYSAYGGESDASVDDRSLVGNENFGHLNGDSDLDSDTDIDPMNAGLYQSNSEDDSEWEMEADIEGNALESLMGGARPHGSLISNGNNAYMNWRMQSLASDIQSTYPLRRRERMTNFGDAHNFVDDFGDYLDARGFGDLLDHLAETESSRRGAPPASVSFVNNMPCMTINEDKLDGMACAICKDSFTVGTVVNKLPCSHLYHPPCILPWLSARNTCPLCRYELPTDDKDYEARKGNVGNENQPLPIHHPDLNDESSMEATHEDAVVEEPSQVDDRGELRELVNADSVRENSTRNVPRNRWFFLAAAAAPVVSMVGISLILWFGNPSSGRLYRSGRSTYRRETSQRRWWSFF